MVPSHSSGGSRAQEAPSGFFSSAGFRQGGGGGGRGSARCSTCRQSPASSQSFRLQSSSSCRAALSFSESRSWWITCARTEGRRGRSPA